KYCGFKFCAHHKQAENHNCGKPRNARLYVRKTWLRKHEQNIMTGQYIVVCDSCGYVSTEPVDIESAGAEIEAHVKDNERCSIKKTFLEEVIPINEFKSVKLDEYVPKEDRPFWVCASCRPPQKFSSRNEYIAHHFIHN
ncbi:MAG: hypothetical protein WD154_02585, partial [Nitrosopumilaceae archaeon]